MAEKVTVFKTRDGRLFDDQEKALDHEFNLQFYGKFEEFFHSHCSYKGAPGAQLSMFRKLILEWERYKLVVPEHEWLRGKNEPGHAVLMRIEELDIWGSTARGYKVLREAGITTVSELTEYTESELRKKVIGVGDKLLADIKRALKEIGLSLRQK